MILLLYGKDGFGISEKAKEIEVRCKEVSGSSLGVEKIDAKEMVFKDFWDIFSQGSIFISKRLFFLENVFSNSVLKKTFGKHLGEFAQSKNIFVLIEKQEIAPSDFLLKQIRKYGKAQELGPLGGLKLRSWVKKEIVSKGADIDSDALEELLYFVGNDLWKLSNEIKKLVCYSKKITRKEVEEFSALNAQAEIFSTIDALGQRDKKKALSLLRNHINKRDDQFYLLSMAAYQFRNLILVKRAEGRSLPLRPFALRKLSGLSRFFSFEEMARIFRRLFELDLQVKTGKITSEEALMSLALSV